jgi:Zn-dependent protease with chaperone function
MSWSIATCSKSAARPAGARRAIGVLSAGKYLLGSVDFDAMADRANSERGFFPWLANMLSSHPVHTWRAAALRNRAVAGSLFFRPQQLRPTLPAAAPADQNGAWVR